MACINRHLQLLQVHPLQASADCYAGMLTALSKCCCQGLFASALCTSVIGPQRGPFAKALLLPQVELQGVSLVVLSFFREEEQAVKLANLVKAAGGILGAAVCCAENGGDPNDDWTTCDRDRDVLLDR